MVQHIDGNSAVLATGGCRWQWRQPVLHEKVVATMNVVGAQRTVTGRGECPVTIVAVMKGIGATRAAADAALEALLGALHAIRNSGRAVTWEDDGGLTGDALALRNVTPARRTYGTKEVGGQPKKTAWSTVTISAVELAGGPAYMGGFA